MMLFSPHQLLFGSQGDCKDEGLTGGMQIRFVVLLGLEHPHLSQQVARLIKFIPHIYAKITSAAQKG